MWKLFNLIFGWDYVAWENCADQGIARVRRGGNGQVYYWRYRCIKVADRILEANQVIWLTCEPSKYMEKECDVDLSVEDLQITQ